MGEPVQVLANVEHSTTMTEDLHNLADAVARSARAYPDKVALRAGDRTLTWRELDGLVSRTAAGLLARGLARGDRVGLLLPNTPDFAVAYFAILRAGLVALPLNTAYTAAELGHQLDDSGAALVITDAASVAQ